MEPHKPQELKYLLLNSAEPILFKNILDWELLKWSLQDWQHLLGIEELDFRCGKNSFTKEPQWERTTSNKKATFEQFVTFANKEGNEWMYFDYKYLKEWFNNIDELQKGIKWDFLGFPDISSKDCTIWIGSKGAHTPCHIDTYGCNLVAQIYGQKQWLLFPPEEDLKPTRIPYEESSIYSKLNFFSPTTENFKGVGNCRKVILNPGDVLFIPHNWWHYVENLNTAISINVWLSLPQDDDERLKESLVQLFVAQVVNNMSDEVKNIILNPNSDDEIGKMTFNASANLVSNCKNICQQSDKKLHVNTFLNEERAMFDLSKLFDKYSHLISKIPKLSNPEFDMFLQDQKQRFVNEEEAENGEFEEVFNLINAFTHPEVVSLIKNKLLP